VQQFVTFKPQPRFFERKTRQPAPKCAPCLPWLCLSSSIYHPQTDQSPFSVRTGPPTPYKLPTFST